MYSLHNHTDYSNGSRGFADSSIKLEDLIITAKEYGLKGICITDHEICGSFVKAKKLEEKHDFPVLLGNEIYLVNNTQAEQLKENYNNETMYYPHFLLIGLDMIGNEQIRELSTIAWENAYMQKGLIRTVTLMEDIEKIIGENKGHVIGSSACLGSSINHWILDRELNNNLNRDKQIEKFINWGINTFGKDNFYLECQPGLKDNIEQWTVNNYILKLSEKYNVPYIITTDSHYLSKELLPLHGSFLNSDDNSGEREVEKFYATAYLMKKDEIYEYFKPFWTKEQIDKAIENTNKIGERGQRFLFKKKQVIPKIKFNKNWEEKLNLTFFPNKNYIQKTILSQYKDDRYLMYLIQIGIEKLIPREDYEETFDRLEEELEQFWKVSEKIEDRLHGYFITISKIIEIIWNEGDSIVGVGRGCFTEDALVHTRSTLKSIKDIVIGDEVITKDGKFNKVIDTMQYDIDEELVQIKHLYGTNKHYPSICTLDHKILINKNNKVNWIAAKDLQVGDYVCVPKIKNKGILPEYIDLVDYNIFGYEYDDKYIYEYSPYINNKYKYSPTEVSRKIGIGKGIFEKFANGEKITSRSKWAEIEFFKLFPFKNQSEYIEYIKQKRTKIIPRYIKLDKTFNEFIGLMYGDGFAPKNKTYSIGLAIHSTSEKDKINRSIFNEIAKRLNINIYENKSKNKKLIQLHINSNIFSNFIRNELFISEKNKEKQFNVKWFNQNKENLLGLLNGLKLSDGSNKETCRLSFDNTSKSIINAYKLLCLMTNEGVNSLSVRPKWTDKNGYKCKESYKLRLYYNAKYAHKKLDRVKEDDDYWYLPIKEVIFLPRTKTKVYDITIENQSNYLLNNMIVHNSGVSSIINYLLEITQINPLKMPVEMPFYRFITEERAELSDIDIDSQSDKREQIFNAVKDYFINIGGDVINCCTYTTLSSKAAIQSASRGLKIDTDTAQMISNMIPVERGFVWSLKDVYYGNEDKNRPPVKEFKIEVDKYEGLLDTALLIEDIIINRSVHASGVFIINDNFTKYNAIMRSAKLVRISQWDLHDSEEFGLVN